MEIELKQLQTHATNNTNTKAVSIWLDVLPKHSSVFPSIDQKTSKLRC